MGPCAIEGQFSSQPGAGVAQVAIDRRFGFSRESAVTSAAQADGRMLPRLVTTHNVASATVHVALLIVGALTLRTILPALPL